MTIDTKCLLHINQGDWSNTPPWIDETGKAVTTAYGASYISLSSTHAALTGSTYSLGLTPATNNAGAIAIANHSDFALGASDFTIELWYRPTLLSGLRALCSKSAASGVPPFLVYHSAGSLYFQYSTNGSGAAGTITAASVLTNSAWHHIAVVRSGTTITMYVNGMSVGTPLTEVVGALFTNTAPVRVGGGKSQTAMAGAYGQIDEFRISGVARYTANFSVPTAEFVLESGDITVPATATITSGSTTTFNAAIAASYPASTTVSGRSQTNFEGWTWGEPQTVSLFHFDGVDGGTSIIDENGNPLGNYGHTTSTAIAPKFGSASSYFNTGKALILDYAPHLLLADTDFTVEMWVYRTSIYSDGNIFSTANPINHRPAVMMSIMGYGIAGNETLRINIGKDKFTTLQAETAAGFLPVGSWHHIALCREAGAISAYINGTRRATITFFPYGANMLNTDISVYPSPIYIGQDGNGGEVIATYIDEFRITRRASQYPNGATITVPTAAFGQNGPVIRKLVLTSGSVTGFNSGFIVASPVTATINSASISALVARASQNFTLASSSVTSLVGNAHTNGATFALQCGSLSVFTSPNFGGGYYGSFNIVATSTVKPVPQFNYQSATAIVSKSNVAGAGFRLVYSVAEADIVGGSELRLPSSARTSSIATLLSSSAVAYLGRSVAQTKYATPGASVLNLNGRFGSGGWFAIYGRAETDLNGHYDYIPPMFDPVEGAPVIVRSRRLDMHIKTKTPTIFIREL